MTVTTQDALRQEVRSVIDQEARALLAGDMAMYSAMLTDDTVFMPPGYPVSTGDEAREALAAFYDEFTVEDYQYETQEVAGAGDLAYHRYAYAWTFKPKAGGEPVQEHGNGIHILRRGADGRWRVAHSIYNVAP
jgi:uncharacterized protein (TIGR02246 family)